MFVVAVFPGSRRFPGKRDCFGENEELGDWFEMILEHEPFLVQGSCHLSFQLVYPLLSN